MSALIYWFFKFGGQIQFLYTNLWRLDFMIFRYEYDTQDARNILVISFESRKGQEKNVSHDSHFEIYAVKYYECILYKECCNEINRIISFIFCCENTKYLCSFNIGNMINRYHLVGNI